jgi:hypothetical protein
LSGGRGFTWRTPSTGDPRSNLARRQWQVRLGCVLFQSLQVLEGNIEAEIAGVKKTTCLPHPILGERLGVNPQCLGHVLDQADAWLGPSRQDRLYSAHRSRFVGVSLPSSDQLTDADVFHLKQERYGLAEGFRAFHRVSFYPAEGTDGASYWAT